MFSIRNITSPIKGKSNKNFSVYMETDEEPVLILYGDSWGFQSCAVCNLYGWNGYWLEKVDFDALFAFLNTQMKNLSSYEPKEYYFLISGSQLETYTGIQRLVAHPKVKQVDKFDNKSHSSEGVNLYRYSEQGDFKCLS
jgi:hypothetical protein